MKIRILTLTAGLLLPLSVGLGEAAEKPNIVLILADDVSANMFSCYGRPGTARTPNIDRIANEGVQFRTCFAPAICGPSRALLMTGVYGNRSGAFHNSIWAFDSRGTLFTRQHSWARLMKEGGYKTAMAGKWHCGAKLAWEKEVGFEEFCAWEGVDKIKSHFGVDALGTGRRKDIKLPDNRYWYPCSVRNGDYVDVTEKEFGPDICCEFLLDFIERKAKKKEAFIAYWPTVIPHGPYSTTPDAGKPMDIELPKPDVKGLSREEKTRVTSAHGKKQQERFVNLIEYMDKLIGKLIKKTEDLGIYDNTYFIFCSDNGTAVTAKDRGVERGVHVPFVVKGPGIKKRGVTDELTDFSDVAPTLLDMAGIPHPKDIAFDGKSQLPFLTGKADAHREWIYAYTGPVQVLRTRNHLLEARAPFYGTPQGRLYFTGDQRFGKGYKRVDRDPEHAAARALIEKTIVNLPSHLEEDHSFWTSKHGRRWLENNKDLSDLKKKQLHNHPDYAHEDESLGLSRSRD